MSILASTARVLQTQIDAQYRDAVMLRGLAEAEYASRPSPLQRQAMHLAIEQVRILEDARRDVAALTRTLEAI